MRILVALALIVVVTTPSRAQELPASGALRWRPPSIPAEPRGLARPTRPMPGQPTEAAAAIRRPPWWAPLASGVLPGLGQAAAGQDRWIAYATAEAYAWVRYATEVSEGRRQRRTYQSLARVVAREQFGGLRPVGDFEYYERMQHYAESGAFDAIPGAGVDPEPDTSSFNGAMWLLARRTFWDDPDDTPDATSSEYRLALGFYLDRAIRPQFRWSWRNALLEQDLFQRSIEASNDAFRQSIQSAGVLIANHALSMVDSYITVRLDRRARDRSLGLRVTVPVEFARP